MIYQPFFWRENGKKIKQSAMDIDQNERDHAKDVLLPKIYRNNQMNGIL